jgi:hypothetical protein
LRLTASRERLLEAVQLAEEWEHKNAQETDGISATDDAINASDGTHDHATERWHL